jgi:hypothetical protein
MPIEHFQERVAWAQNTCVSAKLDDGLVGDHYNAGVVFVY